MTRTVTIVLGGITVGALAAGFLLGLDGFGGNVLAELAGVALSVLIAYTLVEALLARQQREQWAAVSAATARSIRNRVDGVAFDFYTVDSAPSSWLKASEPAEYADAMEELA